MLAGLIGDGLSQAHRPTKVIIGSPYVLSRSLCVGAAGMNVRRGRLRSPGFAQNASAFFPILFRGKDSRLGGCRLESLWAWIVIISTVHAPRLCLQAEVLGCLMARNRPQLLPEKLRLIREHLQLDHAHMADQLVSEIESHSHKRIQIKRHWIRNFERGRHEPDLVIVNSYGRLAKVSMELIVDDAVSAKAFGKRLGKELKHKQKAVQHTKKG